MSYKIIESIYDFCLENCKHKNYSLRENAVFANHHAVSREYYIECDNVEICKSWARRYKGYVGGECV